MLTTSATPPTSASSASPPPPAPPSLIVPSPVNNNNNNNNKNGNNKNNDRKQQQQQRLKEINIIRNFFLRVQQKLIEDSELNEGSSKQKLFKNILFHCNDYYFLINAQKKFELIEWNVLTEEEAKKRPSESICTIECTIDCDIATMIAIAEGDIRPMHAYLSGKLIVSGDKTAIREYSPALIHAISRNIVLETTNKAGLTVEILGVIGSPKPDRLLTNGENSQSQGQFINFVSSSPGDSHHDGSFQSSQAFGNTNNGNSNNNIGDTVVRYVLQVHDHFTHEKWEVVHRFSDFMKLRNDLITQGFPSIPQIHTKSSFFHTQLEIINDRIVQLPLWLNQVIDIVVERAKKKANSVSTRTLDDFLQNNSKATFYIQQSSSIRKQKELEASFRSVLIHNYSQIIGWNKCLMSNSRLILTEIQQLKLQIKNLELKPSASSSTLASVFDVSRNTVDPLNQPRSAATAAAAAAAAGTLSGSGAKDGGRLVFLFAIFIKMVMFLFAEFFIEVYASSTATSPFVSFFHHNDHSSFPIVRHWLERIQWLFSFDFMKGISLRMVFLYYGLMNGKDRRIFIRYILIILFTQSFFHHFMQLLVENFRVSPSSSSVHENISAVGIASGSTLNDHGNDDEWKISTFAVRKFLRLLVIQSFSRTFHKLMLIYTNITIEINDLFHFPSLNAIWSGIGLLFPSASPSTSTLPVTIGITGLPPIGQLYYFRLLFSKFSLILLLSSIYLYYRLKRQKTIHRNLQIYCNGFLLILIYVILQFICKVFRFSEPSKQRLYDTIDSYIAPYFIYQIHSFRSIFIKFAQYFGSRSDMLLSETWMILLKELHDSCKASSFEEYVKPKIEEELNELYEFLPEYNFLPSPPYTGGASVTGNDGQQRKKRRIELSDIFEYFDSQCVASASIGQVHYGTINVRNLDKIAVKQPHSVGGAAAPEEKKKRVTLESLIREEKFNYNHDFTHPIFSSYSHNNPEYLRQAKKQSEEMDRSARTKPRPTSGRSQESNNRGRSIAEIGGGSGGVFHDLINVAIKIQHEHIDQTMLSDLRIVKYLIEIGQRFDSRWNTMLK